MNNILNQKIFNSSNILYDDVRSSILKIAKTFIDESEIPLNVVDIQLVGSQAAYNYTNNSDLDIHIIVSYLSDRDDIAVAKKAYYQLYKKQFNDKYNLSIHNIPIELYVDDVTSNIISNGIYSVLNNKWIKFPEKIDYKVYDINETVNKWKSIIDSIIDQQDLEQLQNLLDKLYLMRRNSLSIDGEYGKGNQIFKGIRNTGYLDKLKSAINNAISSELTLEQFV